MKALRCAVYTRKSTEEGLQQPFNSLDAQREACEAYVSSQAGEGWTLIPKLYDDGGFSGGTMERPALRQLLADIAARRVDIVVVYKVDRLTRSLRDFSRIVEMLDAKGAAFVSVTQAFNTTSSMGRLTLNVLMSFAQFEREITGERIRDKVAASKAKGLRMGGHPPLGYDIAGGRLVPNAEEAVQVRAIFTRFLELGSISALARDGVRSKRWTNRQGVETGGNLMSSGAVRYLLRNPACRGVTRHKEKLYANTHPAVVDEELWEAVQARLAAGPATRPPGELVSQGARLAGLLFDDRGHAMVPVHARKGAVRYRYYASRARITGRGTAGSLARIPAGLIERLLDDAVGPLLARPWMPDAALPEQITAAIRRIVLSDNQILVRLANEALSAEAVRTADVQKRDGRTLTFRFAFAIRRRQGAMAIEWANGHAPTVHVNRDLVRAVVMAQRWSAELQSGPAASVKALAERHGLCPRHTLRLLPLAWLAPDLVQRILDGRQPPALTLGDLIRKPLPLDWEEQRRLFDGEFKAPKTARTGSARAKRGTGLKSAFA